MSYLNDINSISIINVNTKTVGHLSNLLENPSHYSRKITDSHIDLASTKHCKYPTFKKSFAVILLSEFSILQLDFWHTEIVLEVLQKRRWNALVPILSRELLNLVYFNFYWPKCDNFCKFQVKTRFSPLGLWMWRFRGSLLRPHCSSVLKYCVHIHLFIYCVYNHVLDV